MVEKRTLLKYVKIVCTCTLRIILFLHVFLFFSLLVIAIATLVCSTVFSFLLRTSVRFCSIVGKISFSSCSLFLVAHRQNCMHPGILSMKYSITTSCYLLVTGSLACFECFFGYSSDISKSKYPLISLCVESGFLYTIIVEFIGTVALNKNRG